MPSVNLEQLISLGGALMILGAFAGIQLGFLDRRDAAYSWLNLIGAAILTVIAYRGRQWGFVLLEGTWTILSLLPLLRGAGGSGTTRRRA